MQSQFKILLLTFSHLLAAKDGLGKYSSHSRDLAVKMSVQVSSSEALKASKDQVRSGSSPFISFQFLSSVFWALGQLRDSEMNLFAERWGRWTLVHVARIRFGSKKFEALRAAYPLREQPLTHEGKPPLTRLGKYNTHSQLNVLKKG